MSANDFLTLEFDDVGIDVVLNFVFLLLSSQDWLGRVECHNMGVSVERELLRILVQFLQMVLGLGHEGQNLELRRQ